MLVKICSQPLRATRKRIFWWNIGIPQMSGVHIQPLSSPVCWPIRNLDISSLSLLPQSTISGRPPISPPLRTTPCITSFWSSPRPTLETLARASLVLEQQIPARWRALRRAKGVGGLKLIWQPGCLCSAEKSLCQVVLFPQAVSMVRVPNFSTECVHPNVTSSKLHRNLNARDMQAAPPTTSRGQARLPYGTHAVGSGPLIHTVCTLAASCGSDRRCGDCLRNRVHNSGVMSAS